MTEIRRRRELYQNTHIHRVPVRAFGTISGDAFNTSSSAGGQRRYSWWRLDMERGQSSVPSSTMSVCVPADSMIRWQQLYEDREAWLLGATIASPMFGAHTVYDRLAHVAGLLSNTLDPQVFASAPLTRFNGTRGTAVGNEIWLEVYSTTNLSINQTVTCSYTNELGVAGRTATCRVAILQTVTRMAPFRLQAGDRGVLSVESLTLGVAVSGASTGSWGITIARPLMTLSVGGTGLMSNPGGAVDHHDFGGAHHPSPLFDDSCLALRTQIGLGSSAASFYGDLFIGER